MARNTEKGGKIWNVRCRTLSSEFIGVALKRAVISFPVPTLPSILHTGVSSILLPSDHQHCKGDDHAKSAVFFRISSHQRLIPTDRKDTVKEADAVCTGRRQCHRMSLPSFPKMHCQWKRSQFPPTLCPPHRLPFSWLSRTQNQTTYFLPWS